MWQSWPRLDVTVWFFHCFYVLAVHLQVFIYTMDRIVWLIVVTVVANFLFEFSGVLAGTKGIYVSPLARTQQVDRAQSAVNPDDVELVDPMQATPTDRRSSRIKLFDNIFQARESEFLFDLHHFARETCRIKSFWFFFLLRFVLYFSWNHRFQYPRCTR